VAGAGFQAEKIASPLPPRTLVVLEPKRRDRLEWAESADLGAPRLPFGLFLVLLVGLSLALWAGIWAAVTWLVP
jgi:hypothetical protein